MTRTAFVRACAGLCTAALLHSSVAWAAPADEADPTSDASATDEPDEPDEPDPEPSEGGEPTVSVYKAQVTGSVDRKSIVHMLALRRRFALACYEKQLEDHPALAGSIMLVLTISPEGAVKTVKVRRDKLGNAQLRQCLMDEAKHWGFENPAGGGMAVVKQTLKFSPGT